MKVPKISLLKGIRVAHAKATEAMETAVMPVPPRILLPMKQHPGPPCEPLVKPGDRVLVGQPVGGCGEGFCAPIHSGVSGVVKGIEPVTTAGGERCDAVAIEADGRQEVWPEAKPPDVRSREMFLDAVRASGLVGLGGAGFPTWAKLTLRPGQKADRLLVNAAECEPFITSDYREILENTDNLTAGVDAVRRWLDIPEVVVGIEENKPEAVRLLKERAAASRAFTVRVLPSRYPKGAEKVLIRDLTGRVVPEGKLPIDVGALVLNVATAAFLGGYLKDGMPLVKRRVTVDGAAIRRPQNVLAVVGTPVKDIAEFCGGFASEPRKVLMGGPMMGVALWTLDAPILKNNNALLFFDERQATAQKTTACIRCGKCRAVCPVRLSPAALERAYEARDANRLAALKVNLCIDCGCCSWVCPAKRPLAQANRASKQLLSSLRRTQDPKSKGSR